MMGRWQSQPFGNNRAVSSAMPAYLANRFDENLFARSAIVRSPAATETLIFDKASHRRAARWQYLCDSHQPKGSINQVCTPKALKFGGRKCCKPKSREGGIPRQRNF